MRKIDSLVADKVMGWEIYEFKNLGIIRAYAEDEVISIPDDFCPSEDIQDAWWVVEKLRSKGKYLHVCPGENGYYIDIWYKDEHGAIPYESVFNESAPLAICKAALLSVGVETEE